MSHLNENLSRSTHLHKIKKKKKNGIHFCRNRKFGYGGVLFSRDKYDLQGIENGFVTSNQAESGNQINKEIEEKKMLILIRQKVESNSNI